jgi:hypothetical protein
MQDTNDDYNNSNQLSNYQLQYFLFTNVHYGHPTDLIKTCKTHVYSLPLDNQGSLLIFYIFYEKETKITEIKQSNINLIKLLSILNYLIKTVNKLLIDLEMLQVCPVYDNF